MMRDLLPAVASRAEAEREAGQLSLRRGIKEEPGLLATVIKCKRASFSRMEFR